MVWWTANCGDYRTHVVKVLSYLMSAVEGCGLVPM